VFKHKGHTGIYQVQVIHKHKRILLFQQRKSQEGPDQGLTYKHPPYYGTQQSHSPGANWCPSLLAHTHSLYLAWPYKQNITQKTNSAQNPSLQITSLITSQIYMSSKSVAQCSSYSLGLCITYIGGQLAQIIPKKAPWISVICSVNSNTSQSFNTLLGTRYSL
jgi:hypothetical protein